MIGVQIYIKTPPQTYKTEMKHNEMSQIPGKQN